MAAQLLPHFKPLDKLPPPFYTILPPLQPNAYLILPPIDKLPPHSYTILTPLAAQFLHHFTPSEQMLPSLLHHFTPMAAQLLHHFTLSEQINYSLTLTPLYPPWQPNSFITLPPLNKLPPHSYTILPPGQTNSYIILPPLNKLPPHSYINLPPIDKLPPPPILTSKWEDFREDIRPGYIVFVTATRAFCLLYTSFSVFLKSKWATKASDVVFFSHFYAGYNSDGFHYSRM